MKHLLRVVSLLLVSGLFFLTGCSNPNVIAIVNKTEITRQQLNYRINFYLAQQNMTLEDVKEDKDIYERLKTDVLFELEANAIALEEAKKLGLDKLNENDTSLLNTAFEANIEQIKQELRTGVQASASPSTDLEKETQIALDKALAQEGFTLETYRQKFTDEYIILKVRDYYTNDVKVSEDEVKKQYEQTVETQKKSMESKPEIIEQYLAFNYQVYYYPAGYRYVKHILIKIPSEVTGQAAIFQQDGKLEEMNKVLEPALNTIKPKAEEVLAKIQSGEDFDALMAEYGEDPGMQAEPSKTQGYLVGPYNKNYLREFLNAALLLKSEGETSGLVPTIFGYHIIKAVKIIPEGAVSFESVRSELEKQLLKSNKQLKWYEIQKSWVDKLKAEGNIKEFLDNLKD